MQRTNKSLQFGTCLLALGGLFSQSAVAGAAEDQRVLQLEQKLAASMVLIEQLNARLEKVENARAESTLATPVLQIAKEPVEAEPAAVEASVAAAVAASPVNRHDVGVPLRGFADVGYVRTSDDHHGRSSSFSLGSLDIYLTPSLGNRVKSIIELVFEYGAGGHGLATDLERLQFGYTFSDALTVWSGRFHTPLGSWNTAFHHGLQIQTAASRPRFVDFEDKGGVLPTHSVGVMASGLVRLGSGKLGYDAFVANGNRIAEGVLDFNAFKDDNSNKMIGANVRYSFSDALEGLTVGTHAFRQQVSEVDEADHTLGSTEVNMAGVYGVLDRNDWQIMMEYYRFRNKDLSDNTGTHPSWAAFMQVAYSVDDWLTPYVRYEKAAFSQQDRYFTAQESGRSYRRTVAGINYALSTQTALKFELSRGTEMPRDLIPYTFNEARLQFAVRF
jgi:hypothetical protein